MMMAAAAAAATGLGLRRDEQRGDRAEAEQVWENAH